MPTFLCSRSQEVVLGNFLASDEDFAMTGHRDLCDMPRAEVFARLEELQEMAKKHQERAAIQGRHSDTQITHHTTPCVFQNRDSLEQQVGSNLASAMLRLHVGGSSDKHPCRAAASSGSSRGSSHARLARRRRAVSSIKRWSS